MESVRGVASTLWIYRRFLTVTLVPLLVLPIPLVIQTKAALCGYILIVMAVFWCTEILPIPVTGMIPIFFMPLTGLTTADSVSKLYYKDVMMLVTGSIMVAIAIENANLHKRIALGVLVLLGPRPKRLLLGFMLPTFFLSMWIANTSTAAMMLPIMEAVLKQLEATVDACEDLDRPPNKANGHTNIAYKVDEDRKELESNGSVVTAEPIAFEQTKQESDNSEFSRQSSSNKIFPEQSEEKSSRTTDLESNGPSEKKRALRELCKGFTLSICYSASVGGTANLTGTSTNIVMKGWAEDLWKSHGYAASPVNFASWMIFGMPVAFMNFIVLYIWLGIFYLGFREMFGCKVTRNSDDEEKVARVIRKEFDSLGRIRYSECVTGLAFIAMVFLWFFRAPGFMSGWGDLPMFKAGYLGDAVPPMLVAFTLFVIPASIPRCGKKANAQPLLDWRSVHQRHPWDMIFLMGGGFALADACQSSGLSAWIGDLLMVFEPLPGWAMILIICLIVALWTEVTSNAATCTLLMPIMSSMADSLCINPLYLMLPVALSCSYAFMLPVATQANALAFSYGRLRVIDMVKAGAILNILCVLTVTLATETWGKAYFDFNNSPWCNKTSY